MDFIVGLSHTHRGYDSIWVIVDWLAKVAHFISVNTKYNGPRLTEVYVEKIVCSQGVPKKIVSNRVTRFMPHFWKQVHISWESS